MTGFIVSVFPFRNRVSPKEAFEGLELGEGKPSRPVLRGPGGRKAAWLLGKGGIARRTYPVCRLTDASVPGPLRDVQTVWHILCRVVVTRHRGRGSPREVIVQHAPEALVAGEADIFQG